MPGRVFHELYLLWCRPERRDEYFGTLVNAWIAEGGEALGVQSGREYVDVGTVNGYRHAIQLLQCNNGPDETTLHNRPHQERVSEDGAYTAA